MKPTRTFVAAAVVATAAAVLSPTPAPAAVTLPTGLTSLLADGTPSGRAIVELLPRAVHPDVSALQEPRPHGATDEAPAAGRSSPARSPP